jgi:hypothetical protein
MVITLHNYGGFWTASAKDETGTYWGMCKGTRSDVMEWAGRYPGAKLVVE